MENVPTFGEESNHSYRLSIYDLVATQPQEF